MDIEEYVQKHSKADRTKHINLNTPCQDAYARRGGCGTKKGDPITSFSGVMQKARVSLKEYLNLSGNTNRRVNVCHLCDSNTKHGGKCVNPEHLYFGSTSENMMDKPVKDRKRSAILGGRRAIASGNHNTHQQLTCPHCNKSGQGIAMKRWHFDNCKHK